MRTNTYLRFFLLHQLLHRCHQLIHYFILSVTDIIHHTAVDPACRFFLLHQLLHCCHQLIHYFILSVTDIIHHTAVDMLG